MRTRGMKRHVMNLESMEERNAPSGGLASGLHSLADARREHVGVPHAHVQQTHAQRASDDNVLHHRGLDEKPGHNAVDDNLPKHSGLDDGAKHNAGDDNNHNRHGGR